MTEDRSSFRRQPRADAQRNLRTLLQAAKAVFAEAGINAPVRDIAERAGVGIGTVYRHFPRRPDLVAAVFRNELGMCADAAASLAAEHPPYEALRRWMHRFAELAATKHGIAQALHSGDPAFDGLPAQREQRLRPAFAALFTAAQNSGEIRTDIDADAFLEAAALLFASFRADRHDLAQRLVLVLVDGLSRTDRAGERTEGT